MIQEEGRACDARRHAAHASFACDLTTQQITSCRSRTGTPAGASQLRLVGICASSAVAAFAAAAQSRHIVVVAVTAFAAAAQSRHIIIVAIAVPNSLRTMGFSVPHQCPVGPAGGAGVTCRCRCSCWSRSRCWVGGGAGSGLAKLPTLISCLLVSVHAVTVSQQLSPVPAGSLGK